mmetsp:Transcript_1234/g.3475  ORF Transcript_1234/g.3475 Transcript_1234/m.3475 type:complete len:483 (+) Transcript_1234:64-1512(+)
MVANGVGNPNSSLIVLYRIVNSESDSSDPLFNAFSMPRPKKGPTLATVKQNCRALNGLSHLGPEGYHWRVCVEEKPAPGEESSRGSMSWWDIQDENAVLPIKEASSSQLGKFFAPPKEDTSDATTKAVRGAAKGMMRAMAGAVAGSDGAEHGPLVSVIAFKLLDMVKMNDDFKLKNPGRIGGASYQPAAESFSPAPAAPQPRAAARTPAYQAPPPRAPSSAGMAPRAQAAPRAPSAPAPVQANLMDFSPAPSSGARKNLYHTTSSPAAFNSAANPNETRAEKLKREYDQKKQKASADLEWDEVEQRMVQKGSMKNGAPAPATSKGAKIQGTKLDSSSTIGKSPEVAQAVNKRIQDMKESQDKALKEVREREAKAQREKAEEDEVRKKLEPKIKAWSEEHGKKKQLRALLGTLHTILWPGANWKPVSIGDILDDSKVKKFYHKASRVVHPDKTHNLDPEKRFLAKRIFDALTQAKVEFDNGKK